MYHKYKKPNPIDGEGYYAIHEYYNMDDGPGWTESPVEVTGDSVEDVKKALMLMLNDIDKHGVKNYHSDDDDIYDSDTLGFTPKDMLNG
jgi:hypothetical protein